MQVVAVFLPAVQKPGGQAFLSPVIAPSTEPEVLPLDETVHWKREDTTAADRQELRLAKSSHNMKSAVSVMNTLSHHFSL